MSREIHQLDFVAMFHDYVEANQKAWAHDRASTLGASETFDCIRKVWFAKNGTPKDEDYEESWGAMQRGDVMENHFVVPALKHGVGTVPGARLLGSGKKQKTLVLGQNSATPDGLIVGLQPEALAKYGVEDIEADCIVVEIKSIDPRVNLVEEKAIHRGQVHMQLGLIRELTPYKPVYAVILYVESSFFDNIKPFIVKFDERKFQRGQIRAEQLFKTKDPGQLPPEGKFDGACKYCPFKDACAAATLGIMPTKEETERRLMQVPEDAELKALAVEHERLRAAKDAAEAEYEQQREKIRQHLTAVRSRGEKHGNWKVSWFSQKGRKKLDKERLVAETGIDLSLYEVEGTGFDKLVVSVDDDLVS